MTLAVHPPGGRESIGVLSKKILIYTASLMLSGALTGFLYSILFFLIGTLLPEPVKIMILSSLAFLYILHEGGIFRLKVSRSIIGRFPPPGSTGGMDGI